MVRSFKNKFEYGGLMHRLLYLNATFMYNKSYQYNPRQFYWWWLLLVGGGSIRGNTVVYRRFCALFK